MSRISQVFEQLQQQGKKALIPYLTAGDPKPDWTLDLLHELVAAGADMIELGVPFSDPMADGPVIQAACERALAKGTRLVDVLAMVEQFRQTNQHTPIILMGYVNPVEALGYEHFVERCQAVGVDGVLMVDMPPEEAEDFVKLLDDCDIEGIFLLAPTTTDQRIEKIVQVAAGYLYYVSLKGVTGSARLNIDDIGGQVARIRARSKLPVAVGFGIHDAASAAAVAAVADGVIVGSAIVKRIAEHQDDRASITAELRGFVGGLRKALDGSVTG